MRSPRSSPRASLPSVDRILGLPAVHALIAVHGRRAVTDAVRADLAGLRAEIGEHGEARATETALDAIARRAALRLAALAEPSLRPVFNLTGTVLHTNLGRAVLPPEAIARVVAAAAGASNLEFDLGRGKRGERDQHLEERLCRLTGGEAATVLNNNAAAVLLVLNTLARRKEVPVSRGQLIEIGGSFRMPDIMARAGCRLVEVGTTNRTHARDYSGAIGPRTALVMKVHTSNYTVEGFTREVPEKELAAIAHDHGIPFVVDLGSGTLVDLRRYGLPQEPTPADSFAAGADLVTFSGDKLLGGPQAGIVAGRRDLVAKVRRNPMRRAMRPDKMTIAALDAVLGLYDDPDRLPERLPTLRLLTRPADDIRAAAERMAPLLAEHLAGTATVETVPCRSQTGSGSLPAERLESYGIAIRPVGAKGRGGRAAERIAARFRALPVAVIGRIHGGAVILDLRCLEDEAGFAGQLSALSSTPGRTP